MLSFAMQSCCTLPSQSPEGRGMDGRLTSLKFLQPVKGQEKRVSLVVVLFLEYLQSHTWCGKGGEKRILIVRSARS